MKVFRHKCVGDSGSCYQEFFTCFDCDKPFTNVVTFHDRAICEKCERKARIKYFPIRALWYLVNLTRQEKKWPKRPKTILSLREIPLQRFLSSKDQRRCFNTAFLKVACLTFQEPQNAKETPKTDVHSRTTHIRCFLTASQRKLDLLRRKLLGNRLELTRLRRNEEVRLHSIPTLHDLCV